MTFDPTDSPIQQDRLGFTKLQKWNPAKGQPIGGLQCILTGKEEQGTDLDRRIPRIVDIPNQKRLGDQVHDSLSISSSIARSRGNLAPVRLRLLPCERYTNRTMSPTSPQGASPM